MTTLAQDVFTRALALSDANSGFSTLTPNEILWRLNYAQGQLWTRLAQENRFFWVTTATLASSAGASGRTLNLAAITNPPVERILDKGLILPDGRTINVVDFQDQDAEIAPRAYALGLVLNEVGAEWGPSGVKNVQIVYAYRPVDLLLNSDLSQALSVPDRFVSYLDLDLGIYFNGKDIGRQEADPQELPRLTTMMDASFQDILQYVDHVVGPAIRRFLLPVSARGEKA